MSPEPDPWALVGALHEPQRRAVYEAVCNEPVSVTRQQVAATVGISRSLAAFHLDKLIDAGLLDADHRPTADRPRPTIGRPAKRYRRSARDIDISLPARRYDLAGQILAAALTSSESGESPREAARRIARERGRGLAGAPTATGAIADPLQMVSSALHRLGYAPLRDGDRLELGNCPFRAIVDAAPAVTCEVNLALLEGLLAGLELDGDVAAASRPQEGACCVTLTRTHAA